MTLKQTNVKKSDQHIPCQFSNGIMYNHVLHGYIVLQTSLRMATQNAITKLVIKKSLPIIFQAAVLTEVFLVIFLPSMDYSYAVHTGLLLFKLVFLCA